MYCVDGNVKPILTHSLLRRSTSVDEWADFTERNLTEAEKQRRNSVRLRAVADGELQTTCNDVNRQRSSTDLALEMRVNELRDAKEKLEDHLNKVRQRHSCSVVITRRLQHTIRLRVVGRSGGSQGGQSHPQSPLKI